MLGCDMVCSRCTEQGLATGWCVQGWLSSGGEGRSSLSSGYGEGWTTPDSRPLNPHIFSILTASWLLRSDWPCMLICCCPIEQARVVQRNHDSGKYSRRTAGATHSCMFSRCGRGRCSGAQCTLTHQPRPSSCSFAPYQQNVRTALAIQSLPMDRIC